MEAIPLAFPRTEVNSPTMHLLLLDLTCPGGEPVTGLASGTPANVTEASAHEFALTLSTILTCDVPLALPCQANNNELNYSQWDALRVSPCFFRKVVFLRLYAVSKLICILLDRRLVEILRLKLHYGGE